MKILVITGPPYSGKGTQCEILKNELGYTHISTGDRIRAEKELGTEIGKIMQSYEEQGNLVPDAIMKQLLGNIIEEHAQETGIILDGYPRTAPQVDTLVEALSERGKAVNQVINIEVPKDELLARAAKRAETSQRADDKDSNIHFKRIDVFETATRPAIEYMKTVFTVNTIDGMGTIDEITGKIKSLI
ncbi:adenylate kinase family protein [Chitinophagaceae bacterium MMS25-I14]